MADSTYITKNYGTDGGDRWVIGPNGTLQIEGTVEYVDGSTQTGTQPSADRNLGNGLALKTYQATIPIPASTDPTAAGGLALPAFPDTEQIAVLFAQIKIGASAVTVADSGAGDPVKLGLGTASDPDAYAVTTDLTAASTGKALLAPTAFITANTVKVFGALAGGGIATSGTIGGTGQEITVQVVYYEFTAL